MSFVVDYEDRYGKELTKDAALKLYADYDSEWEFEKSEVRQFRDFAKNIENNPLMGFTTIQKKES